jgi:hypothetical protein
MRLNNKRKGASNILTAVIFLIVMIVASGIWEYMRLVTVTKEIRDGVEAATITAIAENQYNAYSSVREGYSGMYVYKESRNLWEKSAVVNEVLELTSESLGLEQTGMTLRKRTNKGNIYYSLTVKVRDIHVETFGGDSSNVRTNANIIVATQIPYSFGWSFLGSADIELGIKASSVSRF